MSVQRTIGLSVAHFRSLVGRLRKIIDWQAGRGRPRALTLDSATAAVLMYLRQNMRLIQNGLLGCSGIGLGLSGRQLGRWEGVGGTGCGRHAMF